MEDWNSTAVKSWAPINSNMETLLQILLQEHPLGSLAGFRNNSIVKKNNSFGFLSFFFFTPHWENPRHRIFSIRETPTVI